MALFLWIWTWCALAGGDVVLILDNSGSMGVSGSINGKTVSANDPERIAHLGAQVVGGLAKGSDDRVTLLVFAPDGKSVEQTTFADLPSKNYIAGTPLKAALSKARTYFKPTSPTPQVLVLLTDGAPTDADDPNDLASLFDGIDLDVIAISYFRDPTWRDSGEAYLKVLVHQPKDLHSIDPSSSDVVKRTLSAFITSYARVLGSSPETGSLAPGGSKTFQAGRFVSEVLVAVGSRNIGDLGAVGLTGPKGAATATAKGHNGCTLNFSDLPGHCTKNRRTYTTFRVPHDPETTGSYTLSLPSSGVAGEYGIILRYALTAHLEAPGAMRMGDTVPLKAYLTSKGQVVDAPEILESPGFAVTVQVGEDQVTLHHIGGGRFEGSFSPTQPGATFGEVSFHNTWLDTRTKSPLVVQGFVPLTLDVPDVDLGSWSGGRSKSSRCQDLDLSKSPGADQVPLQCSATAPLSCTETRKGVWQVCANAPACCGAMPGPEAARSVRLQGADPHYEAGAVTIPIQYQVSRTGFLRCWWLEIAIALGLLFVAFVINGFLRPHSFDGAISVKIAGREAALRRATAMGLSEAPGGKRGFYRNARFGLTNDGHPTRSKKQAQLLLEAGPRRTVLIRNGAGLETQNRRTRKWEPVPEGTAILPGSTYRIGTMYLKFS